MKIFVYVGEGKYLSAVVVVRAADEDGAEQIIKSQLKEHDLPFDKSLVREVPEDAPIIYADNGDY